MCLIAFAYRVSEQWPLLVIANRDEYYQRPTQASDFWQDNQDLLAGKDLLAGGTWMGITRNGRFAAITNVRDQRAPLQPRSRGELCTLFFNQDTDITTFNEDILNRGQSYAGFNLITGHQGQLFYASNRQSSAHRLAPGIYGLSNAQLDTPWPKTKRLKQELHAILEQANQRQSFPDLNTLMDKIQNRATASDAELPDTGVGLEIERGLSASFIHMPERGYGTRSTTALLIDQHGQVNWWEQSYVELAGLRQFRFSLSSTAAMP